MTTVRDGRASHKVREERLKGYVEFFTNNPAWERWLRHHTAIGENLEQVVNVAARAVAKLPAHAREADYERAILDALLVWRAKRLAGVRVTFRRCERRSFPVTVNY